MTEMLDSVSPSHDTTPLRMSESVRRIIQDIARVHGVSPSQLETSRGRLSVAARHHSWAVAVWTAGVSYSAVGRMFGVDHTTVMEGVRRHEERVGDLDA